MWNELEGVLDNPFLPGPSPKGEPLSIQAVIDQSPEAYAQYASMFRANLLALARGDALPYDIGIMSRPKRNSWWSPYVRMGIQAVLAAATGGLIRALSIPRWLQAGTGFVLAARGHEGAVGMAAVGAPWLLAGAALPAVALKIASGTGEGWGAFGRSTLKLGLPLIVSRSGRLWAGAKRTLAEGEQQVAYWRHVAALVRGTPRLIVSLFGLTSLNLSSSMLPVFGYTPSPV